MTSARTDSDRHLSMEVFDHFLRSNVPWERHIEGEPRLTLFIDPARPAIGLRVPAPEDAPETNLEHVRTRKVAIDGVHHIEVAVTHPRLFLDAYPFFVAVADRIQVDGMSFDVALSDTLSILGRLLERLEQLPEEVEMGLFGELLLLDGLGRQVGFDQAISGWRGPFASDHDFGLCGVDIEVKSTSSTRRAHWIHSLTQLVPNPNRPLYMVSYQLQRTGSDDGQTLPQLIDTLRACLPTAHLRGAFDLRMSVTGWQDQHEKTSVSRWRIRGMPAVFEVDKGFPRITPDLIAEAGIELARLPKVRYRIDLTGHAAAPAAPPFLTKALWKEEVA